jgi:integrase
METEKAKTGLADLDITYKDWLAAWLDQKIGFVKESTHATYSMAVVNHIIPALGALRVREITDARIRGAVQNWLIRGRLDGRGGLSEKTVKDILMIIVVSVCDARRAFGLPRDSIGTKMLKAKYTPKIRLLHPDDHTALVRAMIQKPDARGIGIILALHTGLRIGEICAVTWDDIDLDRRALRVTKTIQRIYVKQVGGGSATKVVITPPKTKSSIREIPIPGFLAARLKTIAQTDRQAYLLTGSGDVIEPRVYRNYFNKFLKNNGIPHINFHGLRHTFATEMIEAGTDMKTLSELLGHSQVSMTMDLYVHPKMAQKRKCIERFAEVYGMSGIL